MSTGLGAVEEVSVVEPRRRHRGGNAARVLVTIVIVALLANFLSAVLQSHLREPQSWPTPELQHKFDRISAIASANRAGAATGGTVLVGDSLLDSGAEPSLLTAIPQPVFNASLAGETLPVIASWATRVVTPRLHPSVVVIGFTVNVLNGNAPGEATLVRSYQRSRTVEAAEGSGDWLDSLDGWLRAHVALYRDRTVLRDPFASQSTAGGRVYDPPLSASGWNESFRYGRLGVTPQAQSAATAEVRESLFAKFRRSDARVAALGRLIDQFRRGGARVVIVAMPVSSSMVPAAGGISEYQAALGELISVAARHGVPAVEAGVWPDQDFADAVHLNASGADRFSAWLDSRLQQILRSKP